MYSSDFIGATVGLSCQEVSIYSWMLTLYYELGPFPTDQVRCYRIVRCESDEQKRTVDFLLGRFFVLRDDGWYQPRAEDEKVKMAQVSQKARDKANKRWHSPAAPHDAAALPQHNRGNAQAMPATATATATATELQRQAPSALVDAAEAAVNLDLAGQAIEQAKLPPCPFDKLVEAYHDACPTLARVVDLGETRKRHLQARWRQVVAAEKFTQAEGIEFFQTYFANVARSKFLMGNAKCAPDRKPFRADFGWLIKAENFLKVIEGRYSE